MLSLLHQIAVKIGADIPHDRHIEVLEQATRPESLVEETATKSATGAGEEKNK